MYCDECKDQADAEKGELVKKIEEWKASAKKEREYSLALEKIKNAVLLQNEGLQNKMATEQIRWKMIDTVAEEACKQNNELRDALEALDGHLPTIIADPTANYELIVPAAKVEALRKVINKYTEKRKCEHVFTDYQCDKCGLGKHDGECDTGKRIEPLLICDMQSSAGDYYCTLPEGHEGDHRSVGSTWNEQWKA